MLFCCFISAHWPRGTIPTQNNDAAATTKEKEVHVRTCDILIRERERARDKGKTEEGKEAKEMEESKERGEKGKREGWGK